MSQVWIDIESVSRLVGHDLVVYVDEASFLSDHLVEFLRQTEDTRLVVVNGVELFITVEVLPEGGPAAQGRPGIYPIEDPSN